MNNCVGITGWLFGHKPTLKASMSEIMPLLITDTKVLYGSKPILIKVCRRCGREI